MTSAISGPAHHRIRIARDALDAVRTDEHCTCSVVELRVDGMRFAVEFLLDRAEHKRRQVYGAGPVTDTGLLHALWGLPAGVPIPSGCLDGRDVSTLHDMGDGYREGTDVLTRTFVPAGAVTAVVVVANHFEDALTRVSQLPPIFLRVAAATRWPADTASALAASKAEGIGGVVVSAVGADLLVEPRPPLLGVPAVYRWWISELAYRNWGYANCAHCMS